MDELLEKQKALEDLLMDMEVLEQIESKIREFNAFETLGIINTEIRHSNVLAWLLNPQENHGLGDTFLKKFVQSLFYKGQNNNNSNSLNLFDISLMDYFDFTIRREWRNIDVLAVSEQNKLVIVIENKIWSKESRHQLGKYMNIVESEFKDYKKIYVFLTPNGDIPSDEENWLISNYGFVTNILEKSMELKKESLNLNVKYFIEQYLEILRRYIVGDLDLEKICREIYYKHQKALDLIFEYKPDIFSDIAFCINGIIDNNLKVIKDDSNKTYIRFTTQNLDKIVKKNGSTWTSTNRILLYEIQNRNNRVVIKLYIGPGDDLLKIKLHDIALKDKSLFNAADNSRGKSYTLIYSKELLSKSYFEKYENDFEEIEKKIKLELDKFFDGDIKLIDNFIEQNKTELALVE